jgi:hypothetical protein
MEPMPGDGVHLDPELFRRITKMLLHFGPKMIVIKTVIREQDYSCVRSDQVEQSAEKHIVEAVYAGDDAPENSGIFRTHVGHGGRMILHEAMADVIDGVVINRQQIPIFFRGKVCRRILSGRALGEDIRQHSEPRIGFIGRFGLGKKSEQLLNRDLLRVDTETFGQLQTFRWMDCRHIQRQTPAIGS